MVKQSAFMRALLSVVDNGGEFYVKNPNKRFALLQREFMLGVHDNLSSKSTPKYLWHLTN